MLAEKCPHCGQQLTVEASKELKEILDKLEEALIDFKSGKDFDRSKATAERYIRKANLYYSENPKIKMLLDEVNTQMAKAEKNYKKRNKWYRKHPYVASYIVIELIIIIAAYICGFRLDSIEKDEHRIPIIAGTLLFPTAVMVYLSENNKEKS